MTKILGLDLGTASIGWALVERNDTGYALLDQGVDIFQEGVAREKNSEKPAVQDRTAARALRRHYARRRLRKIDLLRVLVRHDLCPALTDEQLKDWKQKKIYPLTDEFIRWQRTDDRTDKNPYRPLQGADRNARSRHAKGPLHARPGLISSGAAARIPEQSQGCRRRKRER